MVTLRARQQPSLAYSNVLAILLWLIALDFTFQHIELCSEFTWRNTVQDLYP
jgi:hypothetical protein